MIMSINDFLIIKGFIIPGNEIYGGKSGWYDYGHIGVLLKKNIQKAWERYFILTTPNSYFLDTTIFISREALTASGHMSNFNDILVDCKSCKKRYREDHLEKKTCPNCGAQEFTDPKPFNLIFKTQEDNYLRPETAQNIFINFKNILKLYSPKIPFAIAQTGKAFRNEVTISSSIFRTKEFEQMECEWFCSPDEADGIFGQCISKMKKFLEEEIGLKPENIRIKEIAEEDRAHYSSKSTDIEFLFPGGWGELWGLANRSDFDLKSHAKASNEDLNYLDPITNKKYIPHVIEHSIGLNRLLYATIVDAYEVNEEREILRINKKLAPYQFAILPLTKKEIDVAQKIYLELLNKGISVWFLHKGSIGKRYRKNDAIGTPYCITIDNDSLKDLENPTFTIRDRDSMRQKRLSLKEFIDSRFQIDFQ